MTSPEITWTAEHAEPWLRLIPDENDHKYTRGVLCVRTGSAQFPGAAVLGVEAAWRTGLGMVRYLPFEPSNTDRADTDFLRNIVLQRRPETVFVAGRTDAWLIGSGINSTIDLSDTSLAEILQGSAPVVADAGAIPNISQNYPVGAPTIITPHTGEFTQLLRDLERPDVDSTPTDALLREVAHTLNTTVMLKGSVTRVVTPGGRVGVVGPATPWLATAGTGDVLAGIIGALVAQHHSRIRENSELLLEVGLSAALLHDKAAQIASQNSQVPFVALDVAEAIPAALKSLYNQDHHF